MKNPWVKLWRNILNDEKIAFILRRYGHDCLTFWIGLLTKCEDGVLLLDEEVFADMCLLETKRYEEIRSIFIKRGLVCQDGGLLCVVNWDEYQVGESTERVRRFRDKQRGTPEAVSPAGNETSEAVTGSGHETPASVSCSTNETLQKRSCNANETEMERLEGEEEEEREGEGEGETRARNPAPAPDEDPFASPNHFQLANAWYRRYSKETGILISPDERDRLKAKTIMDRIGGNLALALKIVDRYFNNWRAYWFAVTKASRNSQYPVADFGFGSFCTHFTTIAADIAEGVSPAGGNKEPEWLIALRAAGMADPVNAESTREAV